jgi:hypothetical protein
VRLLLSVCDLRILRLKQRQTNSYGAVHSMTRLILRAIQLQGNPQVLIDLHRICGESEGSTWEPKSPQEIANRIFCVRKPGADTLHRHFSHQQLICRRPPTWAWRRTVPPRLARELRIWQKLSVRITWTSSAFPIPRPRCW